MIQQFETGSAWCMPSYGTQTIPSPEDTTQLHRTDYEWRSCPTYATNIAFTVQEEHLRTPNALEGANCLRHLSVECGVKPGPILIASRPDPSIGTPQMLQQRPLSVDGLRIVESTKNMHGPDAVRHHDAIKDGPLRFFDITSMANLKELTIFNCENTRIILIPPPSLKEVVINGKCDLTLFDSTARLKALYMSDVSADVAAAFLMSPICEELEELSVPYDGLCRVINQVTLYALKSVSINWHNYDMHPGIDIAIGMSHFAPNAKV